jgi:hypothetical protein
MTALVTALLIVWTAAEVWGLMAGRVRRGKTVPSHPAEWPVWNVGGLLAVAERARAERRDSAAARRVRKSVVGSADAPPSE